MTAPEEGWRAGDLAVCLNKIGWWGAIDHMSVDGPVLDQVLRVAAVYPDAGLEFDEFPDEIWPAYEFRRIEPDHSAADDAEFLRLIMGMRVGAPV